MWVDDGEQEVIHRMTEDATNDTNQDIAEQNVWEEAPSAAMKVRNSVSDRNSQ